MALLPDSPAWLDDLVTPDPVRDRAGGGPPVGTVTFLLTDVEGSTRAWEADRDAMAAAIARHYELLDEAIGRHDGVRPVEQGEGDSVVGAFARASDAVDAALDAQRRLGAEPWPERAELKVRMAVHTGEVEMRDAGNYFGPELNRCARLRAIAHGGQVLVSGPTADLVADRLPDGASLADLGLHRLKDLGRPERVLQLCHADLPTGFAALQSLDALPNNLPIQLTDFLGRSDEMRQLREVVGASRLVTLTGAGGCGKTRLGLQLAADVLDQYPGGTWLVELAPVTDPDLVCATIATALGERDLAGDLVEAIVSRVGQNTALIVLDNCEHLLGPVAGVVDTLLRRCRDLKIVATSREPLGVPGETAWRVPSLALPAPGEAIPVAALPQFDAVRLFIDRATKARPNFRLTSDNATAVVQICSRLDGIPLAIELAAARVRGLTVDQLAAGLDDRFRLLTGGARTVLQRQQTLQASVEWGYELLSDRERAVFRRLAVFAGTFSLDAAERVVADDDFAAVDVLDLLLALVDKSMVIADDDTGRYRMLETLRQYGASRLVEAGETNATRDRQMRWAATLWDPIEAALLLQAHRYVVLDSEVDSIRTAFEWAVTGSEPDLALRLGATLTGWELWRGDAARATVLARRALAVEGGDPRLRLVALTSFVNALYETGELGQGARVAEEMLEQLDGVDEDAIQCICLRTAAFTLLSVDLPRALELGRWAVEAAVRTGRADAVMASESLVLGARVFSGVDIDLTREDLPSAAESNSIPWRMNIGTALAQRAMYEGRFAEARTGLAALGGSPIEMPRIGLHREAMMLEVDLAEGIDSGAAGRCEDLVEVARRRGFANALALSGWAPGAWALAHGETEVAVTDLLSWCDDTARRRPLPGLYVLYLISALLAADRVDDALERVRWCRATTGFTANENWAAMLSTLEAVARRAAGDVSAAERLLHDALVVLHRCGWRPAVVSTLEALAGIACARDAHVECARLAGAAAALRDVIGYRLRFPYQARCLRDDLAAGRAALGDDAFEIAFAEGTALDADAAVAYAARARGERRRPKSGWDSLTPTEADVVRLAAEGLSNKEIGSRLLMSPETVKTHLSHVYDKVGVRTRAALAKNAVLHSRG